MELDLLSCNYSYHTQPYHLQRHLFPNYLFRLQSEGSCRALVDGGMREIMPGTLLLYAPGQEYELQMASDGNNPVRSGDYYIICRGKWMEAWWNRSPKPSCIQVQLEDPGEPILFLWKQLVLEARGRGRSSAKELEHSLLHSICYYIDRLLGEGVAVQGEMYIANRMKRFIEVHATEPFRSEDVARHVQLSVSRASHLFKEAFGESFFQYALQIRLNMAKERMIYSSLTLEQIAESSGLSSYAFFHRKFKEQYGISPGEFRRRNMV